MKNYNQRLPRKHSADDRTPLCSNLTDAGESCEKLGIWELQLSEGEETNRQHIAFFCDVHAILRGI